MACITFIGIIIVSQSTFKTVLAELRVSRTRRALHSCVLRGQGIVIFIRQRSDRGAMSADYVVEVVDDEGDSANPLQSVVKVIWYEIGGGIGPWGALRPLVAIALALIPFLFIGQHFNRQHRKAASWFAVQFPLILTVILWPVLYIWSIGDAYGGFQSGIVARAESSWVVCVTSEIVNIAGYRFVDVPDRDALRETLSNLLVMEVGLLGTILLSHEELTSFYRENNQQ